MIVVSDENWASPSLVSEVLKEGQEQRGLDFTLTKGTARSRAGHRRDPTAGPWRVWS